MKKFFFLLLLLAIVGGGIYGYFRYREPIDRLINPSQYINKMGGGVMVVTNSYYYKLSMPDGQTLYFSGVEENAFENLTFDVDSVKCETITGVAAAVDANGTLLTARSLVLPQLAPAGEKPLRVQDLIDRLTAWAEAEQRSRAVAYRALEDSINDNYYIDEKFETVERVKGLEAKLKQRQRDMMADIRAARETIARLKSLDASTVTFDCVSHVTARLVNTPIDSAGNDTIPCTIVPPASDDAVVALIKLRGGMTPSSVPVFDLPEKGIFKDSSTDSVSLKVGSKVHCLITTGDDDIYSTSLHDAHVVQLMSSQLLVDMGKGHAVAETLGSPLINDDGALVGICLMPMNDAPNFLHCATLVTIRPLLSTLKPKTEK